MNRSTRPSTLVDVTTALRVCSIDGCDRAHYGRGWCRRHYDMWRNHGDPLAASIPTRFWARVDKEGPIPSEHPDLGPCWLWMGCRDAAGYGRVGRGGRGNTTSAYRWAYEETHGTLSSDVHLHHVCENKACVRSTHLRPMSVREHMAQHDQGAPKRAKTECRQGHPYDAENTRLDPLGRRICRICERAAGRKWYREHGAQMRKERKRLARVPN